LQEINDSKLSCKIIVVVPEYDKDTIEAISKFDCKILIQKGEGFGNALIQGLNESDTKYSCIFNADGSFNPKYLIEMSDRLDRGMDFIFNTRYIRPGGSEDDTIITYIGNKIFTFICQILFRLNISDVLFTYVMGKTEAFKKLKLASNDFTFCIELPVKAKLNNYKIMDYPSLERSRISGKKKVNEFIDGFLILISIIRLFIFKK
jgi:hypothetical protein